MEHITFLEKKLQKHRDGTVTEWVKVRVPLTEVIRRLAIHKKFVPIMTYQLPEHIHGEVIKEPHGMLTYTRLCITDSSTGRSFTATKTDISRYFDTVIVELDTHGAVFWENESKPSHWILADTFAI